MSSEADAVSRYVTDLEQNAEARDRAGQVAAYIQGLTFGWANLGFSDRLKVRTVEQGMDSEGNYEKHMVVVTEAGLRIRITVEPDSFQDPV